MYINNSLPVGCNETYLTQNIEQIDISGRAACSNCFDNAPKEIFNIINKNITFTNSWLLNYDVAAAACLEAEPLGTTNCYSSLRPLGVINIFLIFFNLYYIFFF